MTGKRFEVFKTDTVIGINDNGKSIGNVYAVCDLLNEQYETIQQLQDKNYELKQTVAQLLKEAKETSQKKEKDNIQPYAIMKKGDVE